MSLTNSAETTDRCPADGQATDQHIADHEMRESVRFASTLREIVVRDPSGNDNDIVAAVLDESFGGIGISVSGPSGVELGQEIELTYNGVRMWAKVQNILTTEQGDSRWGLAWKAVGIAARARIVCDPTRLKQLSEPAQRNLARFADMLPGGLYMMWNLFEHGKWRELDEAAERLAQSGRRCGLTSLLQPVDSLRKAMRAGVRLDELRQKLDDLLEHCLEGTETLIAASR